MRLGINIPDKLIKRIKELDPGVNISQVCRETLKSHCRALERINNWIDDYDDEVEEQVMRLSQEPPVEPDWVGYGLEAARDWVRVVDPRVWQYFWHSHDGFKAEGDPTPLIALTLGQGSIVSMPGSWNTNPGSDLLLQGQRKVTGGMPLIRLVRIITVPGWAM